jgi:hypothetical protein
MSADVDSRAPVRVGVGLSSERIDQPGSLQVMHETPGIAGTVEAVAHRWAAGENFMRSDGMVEGLTALAQERRRKWVDR